MIYLDHNASTPVRPEVADAMHQALTDLGANPSSPHRAGMQARAAIERAREQVAALVGARADEVVFVSGGTEGDHLAVIGAALARRDHGRIVAAAAIEHHAVHGAAELLEQFGWSHHSLPCDADGRTPVAAVHALPEGTTVVSLMFANNETGVLQPVTELAAAAHARGMLVHCDAVQGAGKVPVDAAALGVDYLVISAHKFGGPKGTAAVIVRHGAPLAPLFRGSGHERGRRGGTENAAGIVGLGLAAEAAAREIATESVRIAGLRDAFERQVLAALPDAVVHGARVPRLPGTSQVSFPGARSDHMLMALDARGVCASAGAACHSGGVEPSAVLTAMGVSRELAICAIRFSFGRTTSADDVARAATLVPEAVAAVRQSGAVGARP